MQIKTAAVVLMGALALALPASSKTVTAGETQYLRIATLAPRDSDLAKGFMKLNGGMKKATNNGWGVKLYPSGVAGDEPDVLRKMKIGQMDASIITSISLSPIVRETTLLTVPGVLVGYKGWEAVRDQLTPEWNAAFEKNGYKLVAWGETGQLRWFAKDPLDRPSSVKNMRPWLWPAAPALKEALNAVGANGVPLGVTEVYGALQTGMVDMVTNTALALVALQWHSTLHHVTKQPDGVLSGAMLMSDAKWKEMPPEVQKLVNDEITRNTANDVQEIRKADQSSYENLLKRGYTAHEWTGDARQEAIKMALAVQKKLTGRMYTQAQLDRVKQIAHTAEGVSITQNPDGTYDAKGL